MPNQQSAAGVIVFHLGPGGSRTYLVIKNAEHYWEFPKGHPLPGETWKQTARRELEEETGLYDIELIPGFSRQIRYFYRDGRKRIIDKTVCFQLGRTSSTQIILSDEHTAGEFLKFDQALHKMVHAGTRALLRDADAYIDQLLSKTPACVEFDAATLNNGSERKDA
jgi:8-oxo-dGTP pyrophosphatase MutT (NUDIX family)